MVLILLMADALCNTSQSNDGQSKVGFAIGNSRDLHSDCDRWIVHMRSESVQRVVNWKKIAFTSTVSYELFIRTTSNIQRIWNSIRTFDAGVSKFQIVQSSHKRTRWILDWIHGENMTRHTNCAIHLTRVFVFLSKDKQHFMVIYI